MKKFFINFSLFLSSILFASDEKSLHEALFANENKLVSFVENGDTFNVNQLIVYGQNPNVIDSRGRIPLNMAIVSGNKEMVKLLLGLGADPLFYDHWGVNPVIEASLSNDPEIKGLILESVLKQGE